MCHFREYFSGPVAGNPADSPNAPRGCGHIYLAVRLKPCPEWRKHRAKCKGCEITFEEDLSELEGQLSRGKYTVNEISTGPKCWTPWCWNAHPMTWDAEARSYAWGLDPGFNWEEVRSQGRYQGPPPPGETNASATVWSGIESRWMQRLCYMVFQLGKMNVLQREVQPPGLTVPGYQQLYPAPQNQLELTWQMSGHLVPTKPEKLPLDSMRTLYDGWVRQIAYERCQVLRQCPYICQEPNFSPGHADTACPGARALDPSCACNNHGRLPESAA